MPIARSIVVSLSLAATCAWAAAHEDASASLPDQARHAAERVERAVAHGAQAAASGIERGARAAAHGVEVGVKAAVRGIAVGARATARAAQAVADKVNPPAAD
jgi:hypothetical protein